MTSCLISSENIYGMSYHLGISKKYYKMVIHLFKTESKGTYFFLEESYLLKIMCLLFAVFLLKLKLASKQASVSQASNV
jgi:hypothetical protein